MARKLVFENYQPYHVLNRGVDKRIIFQDEADYYRFIFLLHACNFGSPTFNLWRRDIIKAGRAILIGEKPPSRFVQKEHAQLVDILALSLIPNHYHSILEQRVDNGISLFMQKVGIAYSKYFNLRNQRAGRLFQGPFQAILVDNENYLLRLLRYVLLNPLDLFQPDWREKGVANWERAMEFLANYSWSTLPDLLGIRNSKLITSQRLYGTFFDNFSKKGIIDFRKFLMGWADNEFSQLQPITLE